MDPVLQATAQSIAIQYNIPVSWAYRVAEVAQSVGGNPWHLAKVIQAESRWGTQAVNPKSGATGIIQWTPTSAQRLGLTTAQIYGMSFDDQMDLVEVYLHKVASGEWAGGGSGPLDTQEKMALAVFYPALRNAPLDTPISAAAQKANPGIYTVGDYVSFVLGQPLRRRAAPPAPTVNKPAVVATGMTGAVLGFAALAVLVAVALKKV